MYARSALIDVPGDHFDDALGVLRDEVGPKYAEMTGYRGFTVFANRVQGQVLGFSFWETEADLEALNELSAEMRGKIKTIGHTTNEAYQRWDVLYFDLHQHAAGFARSMVATTGSEKYDELVAMLNEDMGPRYAAQIGFRGFAVFVNPERRQLIGLSHWREEVDRDRASELGRRLRRRVNEIAGVGNQEFLLWEVIYFDVQMAPTP